MIWLDVRVPALRIYIGICRRQNRKLHRHRADLFPGSTSGDDVDYTEKLTQIISENDIKSVTVVRMEVPCCGGLQMAAQNALKASGKYLPWRVVTISTDGKIIDD